MMQPKYLNDGGYKENLSFIFLPGAKKKLQGHCTDTNTQTNTLPIWETANSIICSLSPAY